MLIVQDTQRTATAQLTKMQGKETEEQRGKTFSRLVLQGKLRSAVRYLTERDGGEIMLPDEIDAKTGDTVLDVLQSKHPDMRVPDIALMEEYDTLPDFVELDITADTVEKVARRLSGSAGPGGTDSADLQHWLLRFGGASAEFRKAVAEFVRWKANDNPPWAAYRALRAGRLVAVDKMPGVRPLGIGESFERLESKCVLLVCGDEAKEACGVDQLCAGLEAGIEAGVHAANLIWQQHAHEEEWGFLLVDACNAFNEGNRMLMLWRVRHRWPSGARHVFNCYRHFAMLIIRCGNDLFLIILSKEGVTQGDLLAMVMYGLGLLPLIRILKTEVPDLHQPWYADDAGAGGHFQNIRLYFKKLQEYGPPRGYFPEPSKSILIVQEHNKEKAEAYFNDFGFEVVTGGRYLGGFIGKKAAQRKWVEGKDQDWADGALELSKIVGRHPQAAYAGLQKSLQQEWQFLQRVTSGLSDEFAVVEKALAEKFLPSLFGNGEQCDTKRQLACLPVKHAGLALPNPTTTAESNWKSSTLICGHLIAALRGTTDFRSADHSATMQRGKAELLKKNQVLYDEKLATILRPMTAKKSRTICRGKETGAWLSVLPSTVNGTALSAQEFQDAPSMRHAETPHNFPDKCDGCDAHFSLQHALGCKKGGLVIFRHNEIRDELVNLASRAFTPSAVRDEPLIYGRANENMKTTPNKNTNQNIDKEDATGEDERGDLLIRGFWTAGTDCILDVRVTDTDSNSYCKRTPFKVLESQEKEKKRKYLGPCLENRRHFTPFVLSVDGLLGREAKTFAKRLAVKLAGKWQKPYSQVAGYVKARLSIAAVRATHLCLRGSRVPAHNISNRFSQWEDGAGLAMNEWT